MLPDDHSDPFAFAVPDDEDASDDFSGAADGEEDESI